MLVAHHDGDVRTFGVAVGWEAWWARARSTLAVAIESRLPPLEAIVLEGILWGDRGNLPATLRQEFSDTGTVHVLTTAGLHLGIMAALLARLIAFLPVARSVRAALVIAGAWLYSALAGMHLPTVRAATMLTAGTAAVELGRVRTTSAVLAAAAFAVALPHPLVVLSPSFSMSFACVAGIALIGPILAALGLREGCGLPRILVELLRTSCAVQIALWPLQALYFNAFTPYAILTNMIVVPLVGVVMGAGTLLAIATLVVPMLAGPVANITWWGVTMIIASVRQFATLPYAHLDMPPPSHWFLVAYWIALGLLFFALHRGAPARKVLAGGFFAGVVLVFMYCLPGIAEISSRDLRVDVLDVGQADCIVIRAPRGHAMLVDGGGRLERTTSGAIVAAPLGDRVATRTVMPFLLRHWALRLDAVVLTHPHGDHVGGIPVILSREHVDTVYDSAQLYSGPAYHRTLQVIRERHIHWMRAQRGDAFDLGPTTHVEVLAPELPLITGTSSDINNNSVVLRVTFRHLSILLTGDAQSEAEARLLSHGTTELHSDILKVGHHGSAYSSTPEFLAAVHPKIAIISCGLHNVFGHPSPLTLAALKSEGARVYRTDLDGGVSVVSDGASIRARSVHTDP
jgi:competence protein ComEC